MAIEHRRVVIALALVAAFMVFVDGTIVHLTLAQLAAHLDASRAELEWAVNAYTLSFAAVMLGAGAITDALGAKRAFVAGLLVFTIASAACAAAPTMTVLNAARLVQGVGAALLLPSALVLATAAAPDGHARNRLVGWWSAAGGVGMAAGPLLGGALVAVADWRTVFGVNVLIGVPAAIWSLRSMPAVPRGERRLDVTGMATATLLIGGLVFALIEAPAQGLLSAPVVTAAVLAVAGLAGFVLSTRAGRTPAPPTRAAQAGQRSPGLGDRTPLSRPGHTKQAPLPQPGHTKQAPLPQPGRPKRAPLLPPGLYADRAFVATAGQGALFNFAFYGLLFAMSLMLQQGRGLGALTSGLLFLPLTGLIAVANLCAARLARRFGLPAVVGAAQAVLVVTFLLVAWAGTAAALWPLALALVPAGFASGLLVPAMTSQAIAAVGPRLHGAASAAFNTSRQVGGAVGIAVFGPLLGTVQGRLQDGFVVCVLVGAAAVAVGLLLTPLTRERAGVAASAEPARA
ncbi:MFS transporter [Nonomuraea sp. NPDC049309]|uniref:MFS transporter n=1 Tax=Nonomuraea sp. NPDC049309 TaxID=3364350 RepID=UPI00371E39A8